MTAVRPASRVTDDQRSTELGLLLPIISPLEYERQFWSSPVFLSTTRDIDALYLFTRICDNCLFLFRNFADVPDVVSSQLRQQYQRNLTFAVLHVAAKVLATDMYAQCRWAMLGHLRLYSLLGKLANYQQLRHIFATGLHVGHVDTVLLHQVVRGNLAFSSTRAFLIGSCCIFPCLHGLPPVLPFVAELLIQLVYLYFGIKYMSPMSADILSAPKHAAGAQQLCSALSASLPTLQTFLPRTPPGSPAPGVCGVQHAWVLVLFFQLFMGFTLPLYVCYTCERRLKLRFLRQLRGTDTPTAQQQQQQQQQRVLPALTSLSTSVPSSWRACHLTHIRNTARYLATALHKWAARQTTPPGPTASTPPTTARRLLRLLRGCLLHAAALYLLAALCWQLVVALQVPLARRVKPLTFQEGYREWYWELLCGSDQPCCPA